MLERFNADLAREAEDVAETEQSTAHLETVLADLQEELKATKRQRIWDIMRHPDQKETLAETYDELESDLLRRIEGIQNQIAMTVDKRNTIIQVNRTAKTALEVFDDILAKPRLDRNDLQLIIQKIKVYEDHIEIQLKADIDSILRSGTLPAQSPCEIQIIQESDRHNNKVFTVKVISDGESFETLYVMQGRAQLFLNGATWDLQLGDLCLVAPSFRHDVVTEEESMVVSITFSGHTIESTLYRLLIRSIFHEGYCHRDYARQICTSYIEILFSYLLQSTGLSVEKVAEQTRFQSAAHFSRSFRKKTGFSPTQYRKRNGREKKTPMTENVKSISDFCLFFEKGQCYDVVRLNRENWKTGGEL